MDSGAGKQAGPGTVGPANLLGLDYRAEAARLGPPPVPIIDAHTHVNGRRASEIFKEVMDLYGIERTYTQTQLSEAAAVRDVLGDRVEFIAIPEYMADDRKHAFTDGFLENMEIWAKEFGARCVKHWNAPRFRDLAESAGLDSGWEFDDPWRVKVSEKACELGMMFMVHVADPDTWFRTKYKDESRYRAKREHYRGLEAMLDRYPRPWIAAHLGGWPEDLEFLAGLLERHENLVLDTSATKWMVREVSLRPKDDVIAFLERFSGRIQFGSDIVTLDDHLGAAKDDERFGSALASGEAEAFDLYASRFWALRTMWEGAYDGPSPIADPDLKMVADEEEPGQTAVTELASPRLRGLGLSAELLGPLYRGAAGAGIERWYREHR